MAKSEPDPVKLVFTCTAPDSSAAANVYRPGEEKPFRKMNFTDGQPTFKVVPGDYELSIRVVGVPGTTFELKVKENGKMKIAKTTLPTVAQVGKEDAGRDGFERKLTVAAPAADAGNA